MVKTPTAQIARSTSMMAVCDEPMVPQIQIEAIVTSNESVTTITMNTRTLQRCISVYSVEDSPVQHVDPPNPPMPPPPIERTVIFQSMGRCCCRAVYVQLYIPSQACPGPEVGHHALTPHATMTMATLGTSTWRSLIRSPSLYGALSSILIYPSRPSKYFGWIAKTISGGFECYRNTILENLQRTVVGIWSSGELTSSWTNQVGPSIVCARAAYAPSTFKETSCFAVFAELVRPEQADSSA